MGGGCCCSGWDGVRARGGLPKEGRNDRRYFIAIAQMFSASPRRWQWARARASPLQQSPPLCEVGDVCL